MGGSTTIEVRLNDDGTLDEVVGHNVYFHLEQMDETHWWLCVSEGILSSSKRVNVWLKSDSPITASYEKVNSKE